MFFKFNSTGEQINFPRHFWGEIKRRQPKLWYFQSIGSHNNGKILCTTMLHIGIRSRQLSMSWRTQYSCSGSTKCLIPIFARSSSPECNGECGGWSNNKAAISRKQNKWIDSLYCTNRLINYCHQLINRYPACLFYSYFAIILIPFLLPGSYQENYEKVSFSLPLR